MIRINVNQRGYCRFRKVSLKFVYLLTTSFEGAILYIEILVKL